MYIKQQNEKMTLKDKNIIKRTLKVAFLAKIVGPPDINKFIGTKRSSNNQLETDISGPSRAKINTIIPSKTTIVRKIRKIHILFL